MKKNSLAAALDEASVQAEKFIHSKAVAIHRENTSVPLQQIQNMLTRGLCPCAAARSLMKDNAA
jgi:hypothetical protein